MGYFESGFSTQRNDVGKDVKFYGKYRAIVTNNNDSKDRMGRVKVRCPKVFGTDESDWCTPCVPYAGWGIGMAFIPNVGDSVWVEFEEGDPDKPIWSGNWWGLNEIPPNVYKKVGKHHVIQTKKFYMEINDDTGAVQVNAPGGITINGKLTVNGDIRSNEVTIDGKVSGGNITARKSITPNV